MIALGLALEEPGEGGAEEAEAAGPEASAKEDEGSRMEEARPCWTFAG